MKKIVDAVQGVLQAFIGLGAAVSGALMVASPDGRMMGMPLAMLDGSPFHDFLAPGIILCLVLGLGHLAAAAMSFGKNRLSGFAGTAFGIALAIWIFTQVSMIGGGHWLQNLYFGLAVAEISLAALQVKGTPA
jgi:hypothetical protein